MAEVSGGRIVWQLDVEEGNFDAQMSQAGNKAKDAGDNLGEAFAGGAKIAGVALLGLGAGVTLFAKQSTDFARDYVLGSKKIARETGISVESASLLVTAVARAGVSADDASLLFGRFSRQIRETAGAAEPAATKLGAFGISVKDAGGNLLPFDNVLGQVAEKFKTMPDGPEKTAIAMELFGRSGKDIISILNQGSQGMAEQAQKARDLGLALTPGVVGKIDSFIQSQRNLVQSTNALKLQVGSLTSPVLTGFQDKLTGVLSLLHNADPAVQTTAASFLAFGGPVVGASGGLIMFLANLKQLAPAMNLAKLGIAGLIIALVVGLIAGLIFLEVKFQLLSEAFKSFVAFMTPIATAIWTTVKPAVDMLVQGLSQLWSIVTSLVIPVFQQFWASIQPFLPLLQQLAILFGIILVGFILAFVVAILAVVAVVVAVVTAVIAAITFLNNVWSSIWGSIASFLSNVWGGIKSIVSAGIGFIVGAVSGGVSAVLGIWRGIQQIVGIVSRAFDDAVKTARGFIESFVGIGGDIIRGIAKAISGAAGEIKDAIKGAIGDAVSFAKHILGAHSPSKLFAREVGRPIAQGIAQGIMQGAGGINNALASIASPSLMPGTGVDGVGAASGASVVINAKQLTEADIDMAANRSQFKLGQQLKGVA